MNRPKTIEQLIQALNLEGAQKHNDGFATEIDDSVSAAMKAGDERCEYKIGDRVEKQTYQRGDLHQIGATGVIAGSCLITQPHEAEIYLVQMQGDEHLTLTLKYKIKLIQG